MTVLSSCSALRVLTHSTATDPSELATSEYRIDPDHVFVTFKVDHFGFANYVGRFNKVDGALEFDAEALFHGLSSVLPVSLSELDAAVSGSLSPSGLGVAGSSISGISIFGGSSLAPSSSLAGTSFKVGVATFSRKQ